MRQCQDCKYWVSSMWKDAHTCTHPKHLKGYQFGVEWIPIDGLLIEDDEGWAWLVGPRFGCVNFEAKEGE